MGVCAPPFKGLAYRITVLDVCGVPVSGAAGGVFVSESFTQIQSAPQYEDGEEFLTRTASGKLCVNERDEDLWKRDRVTLDLCQIDFEMTAYILGGRLLTVGSPAVTGSGFALKTGPSPNHFSLEVWQGVAGEGACDPTSGARRYVYLAYPHLKGGRRGDQTIQNGPNGMQILADSAEPSTLWADGPGTVSWLAPAVVQAGEHWLVAVTTVPPPTPTCGKVALA
jgi:hypothetical protein